MTNQQVWTMVERFHKPAQNVKIKTIHLLAGAALVTIAVIAIKETIEKSKEIRQLKDTASKKDESIRNLNSRTSMLEYDQKQNESIIESLNRDKKELTAKLDEANNKSVSSDNEKI